MAGLITERDSRDELIVRLKKTAGLWVIWSLRQSIRSSATWVDISGVGYWEVALLWLWLWLHVQGLREAMQRTVKHTQPITPAYTGHELMPCAREGCLLRALNPPAMEWNGCRLTLIDWYLLMDWFDWLLTDWLVCGCRKQTLHWKDKVNTDYSNAIHIWTWLPRRDVSDREDRTFR